MKVRRTLTGEEALRDLIARGQRRAIKQFRKETCCPIFFVGERADGTDLLIEPYKLGLIDFGDDPDAFIKNLIRALVRVAFAEADVVRQVCVMEAWMVDWRGLSEQEAKAEVERYRESREGIRHHPKRYEVIAYSAEDQDGLVLLGMESIIRPAGKRPYLADDLDVKTFEGSEGRFVGLVPKRKD